MLIFADMVTFCINQPSSDPYFNLAAEEYFLKNFKEDVFMLWRSRASVVVGKHQNALAEINHEFVRENQIPVARRLSGGGTVFHDSGNVNFTFIRSVEKIQDVNFRIFTVPVIETLQKLGVDAYTTGRNDLMIDGKKISGNAEHVHKNRVLHHGTLLFNSQIEKLKGSLNVNLSRFEDKSVQSNRSEVTNISAYLTEPLSVQQFSNFIFDSIKQSLAESEIYQLTESDIQSIEKLKIEKYQTWNWIFGYSPRYRYANVGKSGENEFQISVLVERGLMEEISFSGDIPAELSRKVVPVLLGVRHDYDAVKAALENLKEDFGFDQLWINSLLNILF